MTYLVIYNQKWHIWWFTYGQKCHIWSFTNRNDSLKTRNDILLFTCNQKWIIWPMTFCNLWREGGSTPKFNTNNAKNECQFGIGLVNYNVFYLWSCPNAMSPKTDWLYYFCLVCPIVFQYIIDFCWQTLPKSWQTNFGLAMTYKNWLPGHRIACREFKFWKYLLGCYY